MTEYKCKVCSKEYRLKYNCDRHELLCGFLSKTRSEQHDELDMNEDDIPTIHGLYRIIQSLSLRMDKLEKENQVLRQHHKKKTNILDWLNGEKTQPDITFDRWLTTIVFVNVQYSLEIVYNNNLLIGLKHLFRSIIDNKQEKILPIRCFTNKTNTFYIYDTNVNINKWQLISNGDFDKQLNRVCNQFIIDFKNKWYFVNREKMETDESYKDMYINYYKKILGGDDRMTDEARFQKTRQYLYEIMKEQIKSVVEYDIT
jgi:hypothetical protein